ncbi:MAG: NAD(P)/FAD-dependent oxidoreductase [Christensenellaceae bacterium]|jgi:flavin-dependent dehydrogenase|nr:NAD(P)/FAD-dependent oxidoreductase [Christensenellaceae bacterium]
MEENKAKREIIIIGAGVAGLMITLKLAQSKKFAITLFESGTREHLSYDWSDDVERGVFSTGLAPLPPKGHADKLPWTFVTPNNEFYIQVPQSPEHTDYSIDRKTFSYHLLDQVILAGANVVFGATASELILADGMITGAIINGSEYFADLVIDCSGINSKLRSSFVRKFSIDDVPIASEIFYAYRAYFDRTNAVAETYTNKAYLRHMAHSGISWCIDRRDSVDVLIGTTKKITDEYITTALCDLRKNNPCLGENILHGGIIKQIPIRYPLTQIVANGYVMIGDVAFMTIPMLGSGIASSIKASDILCRVILSINDNDKFTAELLWKYQVSVFKLFGADHIAIDYMKRWMLSIEPKTLNKIVAAGLLLDSDLAVISRGERLKLNSLDKLKRFLAGYKHPKLLLKLNKVLTSMNLGYKLGLSIPEKYDRVAIKQWRLKIRKLLIGVDPTLTNIS